MNDDSLHLLRETYEQYYLNEGLDESGLRRFENIIEIGIPAVLNMVHLPPLMPIKKHLVLEFDEDNDSVDIQYPLNPKLKITDNHLSLAQPKIIKYLGEVFKGLSINFAVDRKRRVFTIAIKSPGSLPPIL